MSLRLLKDGDAEVLAKIQEWYGFPLNLDNTFASVVYEKDGKIVGFGWLQLVVEANIILDQESDRDKFEAMKAIIKHGKKVAKDHGFDQMHAFPTDPKFEAILKKHLNFEPTTCVVSNLGDSDV